MSRGLSHSTNSGFLMLGMVSNWLMNKFFKYQYVPDVFNFNLHARGMALHTMYELT